jgi:hypothetical protein
MAALVVVLLLVNLGFLAFFVKKWMDNAPKEPGYPRGGEKPINEFFSSHEPPGAGRRLPPQASAMGTNEVYEIGEQLLDRIDRKIDVLRELLKQADKKIEALGHTYQVLPAEVPAPGATDGNDTPRTRNRAAVTARNEQAAPPEDDKRARIMQLRRRGLTASQIAQEIGMGRGEVDLILNIEEMKI